jgi:hypothetical protein
MERGMGLMPTITLDQARAAKTVATRTFKRRFGTVVGVGITRVRGAYAVKVNLSEAPPEDAEVPTEISGVPIRVEITGNITPR